jgi:hypothetical protein
VPAGKDFDAALSPLLSRLNPGAIPAKQRAPMAAEIIPQRGWGGEKRGEGWRWMGGHENILQKKLAFASFKIEIRIKLFDARY